MTDNKSRAEAWLRGNIPSTEDIRGRIPVHLVASLTALLDEHRGCDCGPEGHRYADCPAFVAGIAAAEAVVALKLAEHDRLEARVRELEAEVERLRMVPDGFHCASCDMHACSAPTTEGSAATPEPERCLAPAPQEKAGHPFVPPPYRYRGAGNACFHRLPNDKFCLRPRSEHPVSEGREP